MRTPGAIVLLVYFVCLTGIIITLAIVGAPEWAVLALIVGGFLGVLISVVVAE